MVCRSAVVLAVALLVATVANAAVTRSSTFLATGAEGQLRPEIVAKTLLGVEDEWKQQAIAFTESGSKEAPSSFARSCATVISAVVQGSGGNRDVAKEYMTTVCNQKVLEGWHKSRCTDLGSAIVDHAMTADNFNNRESLHPTKLCSNFWFKFVEEEQKREAVEAKEKAEREAKEAKERAEREKKEAEEAAVAKKKAEADAKIAAEKRAKEEAEARVVAEHKEKEQKAKREADDAKTRAAEAAAKLAQKKAEAEAMQKVAQEKLAEAATAEKEHVERQAVHEKAEESLRNAKKSAPPSEATKEASGAVATSATVAAAKDTKHSVAAIAPAPKAAESSAVKGAAQVTVKAAASPPKVAEAAAKQVEAKADAKAVVAPKKADTKAQASAK